MIRKIDFMIIGAQKCATTTLYDWLRQHPAIFLPRTKELPFFHSELLQDKPKDYIDICYKKCKDYQIVGGAWVHLMYYSNLSNEMYEYNPDMKCISLLRNPVDRAYSNYWFARRLEIEPCETFEEALKAEGERVTGNVTEQNELTYLRHGHYAEQLKPYIDKFGLPNVFIDTVDVIKKEKERFLEDILLFLLGSSVGVHNIDTTQNSNVSGQKRIPYLTSMLRSTDGWHKKIGRKLISPKGQAIVREQIINRFVKLNIKPLKYPKMPPRTRQQLIDYYQYHNETLGKLIGRDLSSWNK